MKHRIRHILALLDNAPALPDGHDYTEIVEYMEEVDRIIDQARAELREMEVEDE